MEHTRRIRPKGTLRRDKKRKEGSVKINADAITAILAPLYNDLPKTTAAGQHNLTYGEIEWPTLKHMLEYAEKQVWSGPGRFYDLGSGRGRSILFMSLTGLFDHCIGIEVLPERISLAKQALLKLRTSIPNAGSRVKLYETSFLNPAFKYKDARMVFLSNISYDKETNDAIFTRLNDEMQRGSIIFSSKIPDYKLTNFETVAIERLPMTWTPTSEIHILRHI